MAPTDPHAKNHPVKHSVLVVMSPAGEKTFSVECSAGDFKTSEIFDTKHQAKWSKGITEHVALSQVAVGPLATASPVAGAGQAGGMWR